jgi:iron complex transport system substrate-binding protein
VPRTFLWSALVLAVAVACAERPGGTGPLVLVDDAGDTVRLVRPATRVASLAPATTELLFAIGAGPLVVGRTRWCDWPADAAAVTNLGDGMTPTCVEACVGVRPDLVILYRSPGNAAAAGRLRAIGIPTLQLRTDSFEDLARAAETMGRALDRSDSALAVVETLAPDWRHWTVARTLPARVC